MHDVSVEYPSLYTSLQNFSTLLQCHVLNLYFYSHARQLITDSQSDSTSLSAVSIQYTTTHVYFMSGFKLWTTEPTTIHLRAPAPSILPLSPTIISRFLQQIFSSTNFFMYPLISGVLCGKDEERS